MMGKCKTQNGQRSDLSEKVILAKSEDSPKLFHLNLATGKNERYSHLSKSSEQK